MELNLLIDTNVVLDSFLEREPFLSKSREAISLSKNILSKALFRRRASRTFTTFLTGA